MKLFSGLIFLCLVLSCNAQTSPYIASKTVNKARDWHTSYYQSDLRIGYGNSFLYGEYGVGQRAGGTMPKGEKVDGGEIGGALKIKKTEFKYKFEIDRSKTIDTKGELRIKYAF